MTLAEASVDGVCSLSQKEIAARSYVSERQVRTLLALMESSEWALISREKQGGAGKGRHFDVYRLAMPEQPEIELAANIALSEFKAEKSTANGNLCSCEPELTAIPVELESANGNSGELEAEFADAFEANGNPPHTPQSSPEGEDSLVVSGERERAPLVAIPIVVDWPARLKDAHSICDDALDFALGGDIHTAKAFRDLCEPFSGIPCDWELDVLPALTTTAQSFRRRKQKMRTWFPVREHVLANRDKRLAGLPDPKPQSELFPASEAEAKEQTNVSRFDSRGRSRSTSNPARGGGGPGTISKNSVWGGASYMSRQPL
jgi:hypothetical protein